MKYIFGNWKMNHLTKDVDDFFSKLKLPAKWSDKVQAGIAPAFPLIPQVLEYAKRQGILVGAQNTSSHLSGAYTGEVSSLLLADMGIDFVLIGHSERRKLFFEGHEQLLPKLNKALSQDLKIVYCIGETGDERRDGKTNQILAEQLKTLLTVENFSSYLASQQVFVAYEPVWAIGTGLSATEKEVAESHFFIDNFLLKEVGNKKNIPLLYGGSVKVNNCRGILAQDFVDGALVGGASLKSEDFFQLCLVASEI